MDEIPAIIATILLIILLVALIFGIGAVIQEKIEFDRKWGIDSGLVIDKSYTRGYSEIHTETDENGKIKTTTKNYPDTYKLKLKKEVESEELTKWIEVDKETYHKYTIDSYYDLREE